MQSVVVCAAIYKFYEQTQAQQLTNIGMLTAQIDIRAS